MSDLEILLLAYLGSDQAQHIRAEMGEGVAESVYLAGAKDVLDIFTRESASGGRLTALRELGKDWIDLAESHNFTNN